MNRLQHVGPAVALLAFAAGCGGSAAQPSAETGSTPPSSALADPQRGTINVTQRGAAAPNTMWFVRIESPGSKPVAEAGFPDRPVSFSRDLPTGQYRVIAWQRPCGGPCPAAGENGLGQLDDVCGAVVSVASGRRVNAVVQISSDGGCTIATQP